MTKKQRKLFNKSIDNKKNIYENVFQLSELFFMKRKDIIKYAIAVTLLYLEQKELNDAKVI